MKISAGDIESWNRKKKELTTDVCTRKFRAKLMTFVSSVHIAASEVKEHETAIERGDWRGIK